MLCHSLVASDYIVLRCGKSYFSTLIQRHGTLLFFVSLKYVGSLALLSRRGPARIPEASGVKQSRARLKNQNPNAARESAKGETDILVNPKHYRRQSDCLPLGCSSVPNWTTLSFTLMGTTTEIQV